MNYVAEIDDYERVHGKGSADHANGKVKHGKYHYLWNKTGHVASRSFHYGTRSYDYRKKEAEKERKEDAKRKKKSHSSSSKGGSDKEDNAQSNQETMADSLKMEQIFPELTPRHVDHLKGSLAKYGMANINARSGIIKITLDTVSGTFPLVPRGFSHGIPGDSEQKLISDLISVQIQNDMQNDIPTCTFVLGNQKDWSSVLAVNDLIRVDYIIPYKVGDGNETGVDYGDFSSYSVPGTSKNPELPSDPEYDKAESIYQQAPAPASYSYQDGYWVRCLYTGLVSSATRNTSYSGNQETYTIVGQGMAKIMSNIQLSTFSDLQSNLNGYQLLPDDEKTGIGFKGHTSANIVKQIINRFILQNQGGVNTYDYLAAQNGEDITTRASAVSRGLVNDFLRGPMTEEQYEQYMQAAADQADEDDNNGSDDSDDDD